MTTRPRIVLADDHTMFAEMLACFLGDTCEFVAIVEDGRRLVNAVKQLHPDLVVADMSMPNLSGIDALRLLRADGIETRFIFLTMHAEPELASQALKAGASGYLLKNAAGEELNTAISEVMRGRTYLAPALAADVFRAMAASAEMSMGRLTSRQREVLSCVCRGRSAKQIAAELNLSPRTVETHKYEMMHTLGVETTAELIRFAYHNGLAVD